MKNNEPEVKRYDCTSGGAQHCYGCYTMKETELGDYVEWEAYEALQAELSNLQAECEKLRKDAERYRKLRSATWDTSPLCAVVNPKRSVRLGSYCPSHDRLDELVDNLHVTTP